jgi:hypothetical protein
VYLFVAWDRLLTDWPGDFLRVIRVRQFGRAKLFEAGECGRVPATAERFHQINCCRHAALQNRDRRLSVGELNGLCRDNVEIRVGSRQITAAWGPASVWVTAQILELAMPKKPTPSMSADF